MSEKIRNLLLRFLFWLLDVRGADAEEKDPEVIRWLNHSAQDIGFIRYCQMRERSMIRALLIDGNLPMPRDSFIRKSGQRFELHALLSRATAARKITEEKRREKEEKTKAKENDKQ